MAQIYALKHPDSGKYVSRAVGHNTDDLHQAMLVSKPVDPSKPHHEGYLFVEVRIIPVANLPETNLERIIRINSKYPGDGT